MKYIDLSFPDGARNLACDEALLDLCEILGESVLRTWEPETHFAVVGYSNRVALELDIVACEIQGIPILRRCTGGGTVLQGPGCLNYALVYQDRDGPEAFNKLAVSYDFVLQRHQTLFESILQKPIEVQGISDLAVDGRKFSGNAQHRRRRTVLFQGSFLLNLDLSVVEQCLKMPSKQPAYRANRPHHSFMKNLLIEPSTTKQALRDTWRADKPLKSVPWERIDALLRERYERNEWNFKF
jgi:lipoate---protein ligase